MHKPPPSSRIAFLAAVSAAMGLGINTTAGIFSNERGPAPKGMKWRGGVFIPAGPRCNVPGTRVRNQKVADNVNAMHNKWLAQYFPEQLPEGYHVAELQA